MKDRRQFIRQSTLGILGLGAIGNFPNQKTPLATLTDFRETKTEKQIFSLVKRSLLLPEDLVYLNTGSLGPSPAWLLNRIHQLSNQLETNPVIQNWGELGQQMEAVRQKVADFINAEKEEILLTRNTTEGINLIGACLRLKSGDEILTTTHEHGGGENGLIYLAKSIGVHLRRMDLPMPVRDKDQLTQFIKKQIRPNTKVLMLSHVSTITGLRMPFEEIATITRPRDILLLADGAQAPGMLEVDVKKLAVDVYAASGHKWLLGPKETGFLYLRNEVQERIPSFFSLSGKAVYSASSGTRNVAPIISFGEILEWQQLIGVEKIERRCKELAAFCRQKIHDMNGVEIISPDAEELRTGMVSILLKNADKVQLFSKLKDQNIIVKQLPKYNALRFSTHMFNTKDEIDRMVRALEDLLE